MTGFTGSPRLLKGGIVLMDPTTGVVRKVIALQYNPDTLSRTLQIQSAADNGDHAEALRLKGPPIETFKIDAELDATDLLEHPDQNPNVAKLGLHPQLAALEEIVYPTSRALQQNHAQAQQGVLEIVATEAPLTLFVWSKTRVVPVRITEMSITEEAFDPNLNPIRAKISLGMRTLNVNDVGFDHKAGSLFMVYHQQKESLALLRQSDPTGLLGIGGVL